MSDKIELDLALADLDVGNAARPVSRVTLVVDDETSYTAGDDSGLTVEQSCPWATQELAEYVLSLLEGFAYQPYEGTDALLDPAAEPGDTLVVGDTAGILVELGRNFDRMGLASVAAPSADEIEDEYPYKSKIPRQIERTAAKTRSLITKTASEIRLEVADVAGDVSTLKLTAENIESRVESAEGNISTLTQKAESIESRIESAEGSISTLEQTATSLTSRITTAEGNISTVEQTATSLTSRIESAEGNISTVEQTIDGLTVTDSGGTTKISGSMIETDSLYVKAANITGTLTASQIDADGIEADDVTVSGSITATAGTIAGFTVTKAQGLHSGTKGTDNYIGLFSAHPSTDFTIGSVTSQNWRIIAGQNFGVTKEGQAVMTNAVISGVISATAGSIGGWTISGNLVTVSAAGNTVSLGAAGVTITYADTGLSDQVTWEQIVAACG